MKARWCREQYGVCVFFSDKARCIGTCDYWLLFPPEEWEEVTRLPIPKKWTLIEFAEKERKP